MSVLQAISRFAQYVAQLVQPWTAVLQFIFGGLAMVLGFWGWSLHEPATDWEGHVNNAFRTLQLLALQFPPAMTGHIEWQLQVARLALPLVAILASFQIMVGAVTRPFRLALMPRERDHIILHGVNQMTEAALLTLARRGRRIVVSAPGLPASRRDVLEGYGLTVIDTDPSDPTALRALNVKSASAFLVAGVDDLENLNLAALVVRANAARRPDARDLVLAVATDREDIAVEIDAALDGVARAHRVQYRRLCPDRDGLRLELARFAPVFMRADLTEPAHVLVVGLAGRWEESLAQLILAAQDHPTEAPILTLVVNAAEAAAFAPWRAARPDLDRIARIELVQAATFPPSEAEVAKVVARFGPPHLVVILRGDLDAIAAALALRRPGNPFGAQRTPLLARQSREDRLLAILGGAKAAGRDFSRMAAFGGLIRADAIERVLDRKGDDIAIALHAHYLDSSKTLAPGSPESLRAWDDLSENLREANRAAADHARILFATRGLRVVPAGTASAATLSPDDVEALARVEHRRWMADRIDLGWRAGPRRDNSRLIHPNIVDYDSLPDIEREKDRVTARALVDILARGGMALTRQAEAAI